MSNLGTMAQQMADDMSRPATAAGTPEGDQIRRAIVLALSLLETREYPWNTETWRLTLVSGKRAYKTGTASTGSVSGATNASPIVVTTSSSHGLSEGELVVLSSVGGNTAANGTWAATNITATTFELYDLDGVVSEGNGAYTSGGTVSLTGRFLPADFIQPTRDPWTLLDTSSGATQRSEVQWIDRSRYDDDRLGLVSADNEAPYAYLWEGERLLLPREPDRTYLLEGRYLKRLRSSSGQILEATESAGTWTFAGAEGDAHTSDWFHLQKGYQTLLHWAMSIYSNKFLKGENAATMGELAAATEKKMRGVEGELRDTNRRRGWMGSGATVSFLGY